MRAAQETTSLSDQMRSETGRFYVPGEWLLRESQGFNRPGRDYRDYCPTATRGFILLAVKANTPIFRSFGHHIEFVAHPIPAGRSEQQK
jgi:hypothetical protein